MDLEQLSGVPIGGGGIVLPNDLAAWIDLHGFCPVGLVEYVAVRKVGYVVRAAGLDFAFDVPIRSNHSDFSGIRHKQPVGASGLLSAGVDGEHPKGAADS